MVTLSNILNDNNFQINLVWKLLLIEFLRSMIRNLCIFNKENINSDIK